MPTKEKKSSSGQKGGLAIQQHEGTINPLLGAAVGAAVGGVMGAAAAVVLSDKDTRDKLKTAATNLRDQATDKIEHMREDHKLKDKHEEMK